MKKYRQKIRTNITIFPYFNFFRCFRPTLAVIWIYFSQVFGSYMIAMSYLFLMTFCIALFEVPTGILSDKIGRKKTMILGAFFACLESVFYILAFNLSNSHILYIFATIFIGFSIALYSGADLAFVYESLCALKKKNKFHDVQGKFISFSMFAWAIAAFIGGVAAEFSFIFVFVIQLFAQIITLIFSLFFVETEILDERIKDSFFKYFMKSIKYMIKNKKLRNIVIGRIFDLGFAKMGMEFRQIFLKTIVPMWVIGFARSLRYIVGAFGYWFSGTIIDKYGNFKVIVGFNILIRVIGVFAIYIGNLATPFILMFNTLLKAPCHIGYFNLSQKEFSPKQRATMESMVSLFVYMFVGIGSIFVGYLADKTSPKLTLIVLVLGGLIGVYFYYKGLSKRIEK